MTMASPDESPVYEIRGFRLYVNGERQTVRRETVGAALALYSSKAPAPVLEGGGPASRIIPEDLGRLILALEARFAVRSLASWLSSEIAA
jgi:hypothetical protein